MLKELEQIAAKLSEERAMLSRALNGLTEEQTARWMINPEWSIKDALAHLAGAERGMTRLARNFASGNDPQLPDDYDNDVYNARQVAKRKAMTFAQVRAELDAARAELQSLMQGMTAEQLAYRGEHPIGEISLKELLVVIYSHETSHCNEITNAIRESKK